ncbi:MAG: helix-turn-helix transcriptional regulator [Muribaculaceae bacterium]|nr:helix-turn-helix transcriptional regulator [Muribaculaceae bacterium]
MLSCSKDMLVTDINAIIKKDNIDNDIFIFDDIRDISMPDNPIKLQMPIFGVCTAGYGTIRINLKEYNVTSNTLITLLPDHIIHGYNISADFKGLFIGISPQYSEEIIPDIHTLLPFVLNFKESPMIRLNSEEVESIANFHAFLWHKMRSATGFYRKRIVNHLLQALLFETLNIYKNRNDVTPMRRSRNEEIFYSFFLLVEKEFKVDRSVAFYANRLCISPKHLSAVIKAVSGRTAGEWIDNYVILASKVLLRSSSQTIQEISAELNFANQSFFGKYFKQHVGMSPSQYRDGTIGRNS